MTTEKNKWDTLSESEQNRVLNRTALGNIPAIACWVALVVTLYRFINDGAWIHSLIFAIVAILLAASIYPENKLKDEVVDRSWWRTGGFLILLSILGMGASYFHDIEDISSVVLEKKAEDDVSVKLAEAQDRVAELEQRDAMRQAEVARQTEVARLAQQQLVEERKVKVAAASVKSAKQLRQEAEAAILKQKENEISRKLAAVSGPRFEDTVRWLNNGFREKWSVICKKEPRWGLYLNCTSISVKFDSSCAATIKETKTNNFYKVMEYSTQIDRKIWRNTYKIEHFGFVDSKIEWVKSDGQLYPKVIWRISNQGRKETLQGAELLKYKTGSQRLYIDSRKGGSIRRSTSHSIEKWDNPGDMRGHKFESRNESNVSEYNFSVDFQMPGQMGPKINSALTQYAQFCRIKYPDAPELF